MKDFISCLLNDNLSEAKEILVDRIEELISEKIYNITKHKKVLHLTHIDCKYTFDVVNFSMIFRDYRGQLNHYNDIGNRIISESLKKEIYKILLAYSTAVV